MKDDDLYRQLQILKRFYISNMIDEINKIWREKSEGFVKDRYWDGYTDALNELENRLKEL